jgi:F0F1-type ATP synthase epsilon subunit
MLFLLATPEYNNIQSNTTKVRVHLRSGVAEIFDQHQDLMGKVDNNIVEIETNFENKLEKFLFVLQDAVFIVSNQGLDASNENKGTGVYIYAKRVKEINSNLSIEELTKQYEDKASTLESENQKLTDANGNEALSKSIKAKVLVISEETEFLKKTLSIVKELKG